MSEKPTAAADDSASETLKVESQRASFDEKTNEAEASVKEGTQDPTPAPSIHNGNDLHHITTTKEAGENVEKINTRAEGTEYPTGIKLGLISLALCLSVFLMALVRDHIPKLFTDLLIETGQHDYCNCYSKNHRSVSLPSRCWVVWVCLPAHYSLVPATLRQILYVFLCQIRIPVCNRIFRDRQSDMWCGT